MPLDTTLYIHKSTMKLLQVAMEKTGKTQNEIIVMLMKRSMKDAKRMVRLGTTVTYQDDDAREMWKTVHVHYREDEVDYVKDLRNVVKMSDSLILALAARKYLTEIIATAQKLETVDNYLFEHYYLSIEPREKLTFVNICWGKPENPERWMTVT